jgi:hypothetical protein
MRVFVVVDEQYSLVNSMVSPLMVMAYFPARIRLQSNSAVQTQLFPILIESPSMEYVPLQRAG